MLNNLIGNSRKKEIFSKSLDAYMARNRAISSNISNATTPGYQKREVSFEDSLAKALSGGLKGSRTSAAHLQLGGGSVSSVKHEVVRSWDPTQPSGVNNVDIDQEMADLAENQIAYKFYLKRLSGHYDKLNAAIGLKAIQG